MIKWQLQFSPKIQQMLLAGESGGGGDPTPYFAVLKRIQTLQMLDAFGGLSNPEAVFLSTNVCPQLHPVVVTPTPSGAAGSGRDEGTP